MRSMALAGLSLWSGLMDGSKRGDRQNQASPMDARAFVTIHVPGPLLRYCDGSAELPVAAATVRGVLVELERSWPALYRNICDETGAIRRHLNIFVNADHVRDLGGIDTRLTDGDEVTILPAVSGG